MAITTLAPTETRALIVQSVRLIDIRNADEYARKHIPGVELVSLVSLTNGVIFNARAGETVIFHCRAGLRMQNNAIRLAAAVTPAQASLLAGGTQGWRAVGFPVGEGKSQPLSLVRQAQITTGVLILLGVLLGYTVSSGFFLLSGVVDAGLTFTRVTGFCDMAHLLMVMPRNRRHGG